MVRGDTLAFNFQLMGLGSKTAYTAFEYTFAAAEHYDDDEFILLTRGNGIELEEYDAEKDLATFSVTVKPSQTKTLDLARYFYDLQMKDAENTITLMRGYLTLLYDVAD